MTTLPGRISRLALVTALAMAGPVAVSSGPAQAGPIVCDPNSTWYTTAGSSTYEVTHVSGYHVPPGGQTTITKTASWSKTLTAGINVSTGGSASASSVSR